MTLFLRQSKTGTVIIASYNIGQMTYMAAHGVELLRSCILSQGFSLASAIGHSPKIVPDVREFAVQFGQFVRDVFRKSTLYSYAQ